MMRLKTKRKHKLVKKDNYKPRLEGRRVRERIKRKTIIPMGGGKEKAES